MAAKQENKDIAPDNRRKYERIRVSHPVKMEATLRGRFIDIMRLEMSGVTIDMSEGGFSANVDQSIAPGARCRVELTDEDGGEPRSIWGRARRCTTGRNGFVVALEFDEPVAALEALRSAGAISEETTAEMLGPGGGDGDAEEVEEAADEADPDATLELDEDAEEPVEAAAGKKTAPRKKKTGRKRKKTSGAGRKKAASGRTPSPPPPPYEGSG